MNSKQICQKAGNDYSYYTEKNYTQGSSPAQASDNNMAYFESNNISTMNAGAIMKPISLIIVEDHAILRENLALTLNNLKEFTVAGHFDTAGEALAFLKTNAIDVAIIAYGLTDMNGTTFLREALKIVPDLRGLFLSMYYDSAYVQEAFRNGALAYLRKQSGTKELIGAIKQIMNGEPYISPSLTGYLISTLSKPAKSEGHPLSEEQLAILSMAGKGMATKEIAQELNLTIAKIKHRFNDIFKLLGVHNRAQALMEVVKMKLISTIFILYSAIGVFRATIDSMSLASGFLFF